MPKIKLEIELLDKKQSFPGLQAEYDTETRIAVVRRGLNRKVANKFEIDPDHIHEKIVHGRLQGAKVYVDNASRKSVLMEEATTPTLQEATAKKQDRQKIIDDLKTQLQAASSEQKFEEAIEIRNKITELEAAPDPDPPKPEQPEQVPRSINISSSGDIDGKKKNSLDYLIEEVFWKALIAKNKISLSTILIMFMAGGGIFFMIKDIILPLFGVH